MYYVKNENAMAGCLCTDSFDANKPYTTHHFNITAPKMGASYQPFKAVGRMEMDGTDNATAAQYVPYQSQTQGYRQSYGQEEFKKPGQYVPYQVEPQAYPLLPPTCGIVVESPMAAASKKPASSCQMQAAAAPPVHNSLYMMPKAVARTLQPAMYRKTPAACCGATAPKQVASMLPSRSIQPIVRNTTTTLQPRGKRTAGVKAMQYVKRPSQFDSTEVNRPFDYITDYGTAYGYSADSPDLQNFYTYNNVEMDDFDPFYVSPVDVNSIEYQDALKKFYETVGYPNFSPKPTDLMFGPEFFKYGQIKKF